MKKLILAVAAGCLLLSGFALAAQKTWPACEGIGPKCDHGKTPTCFHGKWVCKKAHHVKPTTTVTDPSTTSTTGL